MNQNNKITLKIMVLALFQKQKPHMNKNHIQKILQIILNFRLF